MGMYELIKGEDNGMPDPNKNSISIEDGFTDKDLRSTTVAKDETVAEVLSPPCKQRLVSLDVFRGITVAEGKVTEQEEEEDNWRVSGRANATKKAVLRAIKLSILGLILQEKSINHCVPVIEFYAVAPLLIPRWLLSRMVALSLTIMYMALLYGLYVPDWEYQISSESSTDSLKTYSVKCGVRGDTGPGCNAVGMIDHKLLGIQHLYRRPIYARTKECSINSPDHGPLPADAPSWCQAPFDPEGILSSVMAIVTCLIGLHFGHVIVHFMDHKDRILQWMIPSTFFVVVGFLLDISGMHVNKVLYTFSYTCVTAGVAGLLFAGTYILGFYWKQPQNNVASLLSPSQALICSRFELLAS
ncbi:hypothetical protein QJS10_CPA16g00729 [Acorus calamus]|uniref:Uncharacterized protein n=1 Tax=Acorus calamus TaxID=4465 RepID=A0AAV9D0M6_ACOCL|nr:hypothetical protein QJS10_CPA16g00729 [Acorus calamus]